MRSLMIGDCERYVSPYMRGVAQAMRLMGHVHEEVSIRMPAKAIEARVRLWQPDLIWTHMLLWPPPGSPPVDVLIGIMDDAANRGARIVIHDGDAKPATRYPEDISTWCEMALVNHGYYRSEWRVPIVRWPYFAMVQDAIAEPESAARFGDLFFAGSVGGGIYSARSALLDAIKARGIEVRTPPPDFNTFDRTAEIAASAQAVLGFGRPDVPGWVDTRVFQYAGAGGILLHDDVQGYLEPWVHYAPYVSGNADSVVDALHRLRYMTDKARWDLRRRAFAHVQEHHSSIARVRLVLKCMEMAA